jgi:hypothetical protein
MFTLLLFSMIAAGMVHAHFAGVAAPARVAEYMLVYVLVGYCGIAQLAVGASAFVSPSFIAHLSRVGDVGELLPWMGSMYLGAAVAAVLAIRLRGDYLIGPVLVWAGFFAGATWAHLHTESVHGRDAGLHGGLWIFSSHGLVSLVLLGSLWLSRRGTAGRVLGRTATP